MTDFFDLVLSQPLGWRVAIVIVALFVLALVAGASAAFFEELVAWAIGPVRLRIRMARVRREQHRANDEARRAGLWICPDCGERYAAGEILGAGCCETLAPGWLLASEIRERARLNAVVRFLVR